MCCWQLLKGDGYGLIGATMGLLNVALELTPVLGSEGRGSVVKMRVGEMLLKWGWGKCC